MADLVKWCLYIVYYYGRFTGLVNFEIDLKTGRTRVTKWATIYAAFVQIILFTILFYHTLGIRFITSMWVKANLLHEYVFMIMSVLRILCVLMALISRWFMRRRFVRLFNSFRRLFQSNPEAIQYCRMGIAAKCLCSKATEILQVTIALVIVKKYLTIHLVLGIWSVVSLTAIINLIITQYYIAIANIRGSYMLLNKELRLILSETQSLIPNRRGVFVTKCCHLADRLDIIARTQSELQDLTDRLSKTYEVQIFWMAISYYLNSVGSIYIMFSFGKYKNMVEDWPLSVVVLGVAYFLFFYFDNWINMYGVFELSDLHAEMLILMEQRTVLLPCLDNRLEAAFDSFGLSLARNPFKLRFFGSI
uniref:Gustatory receptor n=1 Tax=Drosophila rhopaloa TaxID=1041015 RepID=A0A6P4E9Y0_DRORH